MTDELRDELRAAAAAGGGSRPDVADLWRTGRRRRTGRRVMGAGVVVVLLLAIGTLVTSRVTRDDAESVRAGTGSQTCEPRPPNPAEGPFTMHPVPLLSVQVPKTAAAMVRGGGSEHLTKPTVVARVKVLSTEERQVRRQYVSTEDFAGPAPFELLARVEVTDSVLGAEAGDRFTISDAGSAGQLAELEEVEKRVKAQVSDVQDEIDRLNLPLADLDAVIAKTDPNAPGYGELMTRRSELKDSTDAQRNAAQAQLNNDQQRLQVLLLSERLTGSMPTGTSCHRFEPGDDLVVALVRPRKGPYELTGPSSFFLVDGDGFSDELDAARRSVPGWTDSELLRLARESSVDEFLDRLRAAAP